MNISFDTEPEPHLGSPPNADDMIEHVLAQARPGSIILLHAISSSGIESRPAIPGIVQQLHEQGYSFVTMSQLLALR